MATTEADRPVNPVVRQPLPHPKFKRADSDPEKASGLVFVQQLVKRIKTMSRRPDLGIVTTYRGRRQSFLQLVRR